MQFVTTLTLGAARVTAITHGVLYWAPALTVEESTWRDAMPEADDEGRIPCEMTTLVIELHDAVVLVDPGPDEPGSVWSDRFAREWPGSTRTAGLEVGLHDSGLTTQDVTHVIITHAHFDHFAAATHDVEGRQMPRFPNATYILHGADWEGHPEHEAQDSDLAARLGAIERSGKLQLVHTETEVAPDIRLIPAPGETPGHSAIRMESEGRVLWAVGDLAHHECEISHAEWVPTGRDQQAMLRSRELIYADAADSDAIVVFTHERFPPWGRIVRQGTRYRWQRLDTSPTIA